MHSIKCCFFNVCKKKNNFIVAYYVFIDPLFISMYASYVHVSGSIYIVIQQPSGCQSH